jgi:hypothetical protein
MLSVGQMRLVQSLSEVGPGNLYVSKSLKSVSGVNTEVDFFLKPKGNEIRAYCKVAAISCKDNHPGCRTGGLLPGCVLEASYKGIHLVW